MTNCKMASRQTMIYNTLHRKLHAAGAAWIPLNNGGELRCYELKIKPFTVYIDYNLLARKTIRLIKKILKI